MMKWSKLGAASAVVLLAAGLAGAGAGAVASASAAGPKVVGVCTNTKNGGYLRMLEAGNLIKSQWGKCRKNEARVLVPTMEHAAVKTSPYGVDRPFRLVLNGGPALACSWAASTKTLTCSGSTPSPSSSPSS